MLNSFPSCETPIFILSTYYCLLCACSHSWNTLISMFICCKSWCIALLMRCWESLLIPFCFLLSELWNLIQSVAVLCCVPFSINHKIELSTAWIFNTMFSFLNIKSHDWIGGRIYLFPNSRLNTGWRTVLFSFYWIGASTNWSRLSWFDIFKRNFFLKIILIVTKCVWHFYLLWLLLCCIRFILVVAKDWGFLIWKTLKALRIFVHVLKLY